MSLPPQLAWWHLILHTQGSWLHGDPRGFRTRKHRIHSSGDYKSPPPCGEHQNLYQYEKEKLKNAVVIPTPFYSILGQAVHAKCVKMNLQTLAISVGPTHAHLQVQLENNYRKALQYTGKIKQAASHAVREVLPGTLWARGGKPIAIRDREHQIQVYRYIQTHAKHGDWVWTFEDELKD